MSYFQNSNKILILIIAVLAATNIATIVTVYYSNDKPDKNIVTTRFDNTRCNEKNRSEDRFMKQQLNLTPEQAHEFRRLRNEVHTLFRQKNEAIMFNRRLLYAELAQEQVNYVVLDSLSDVIGRLHSEIKKLSVEHYIGMRKVCNQEQRVKLYEMFKRRFEEENNMRPREFRRQHRGRYGRNRK